MFILTLFWKKMDFLCNIIYLHRRSTVNPRKIYSAKKLQIFAPADRKTVRENLHAGPLSQAIRADFLKIVDHRVDNRKIPLTMP
jgi:hypothetical protein